MKPILSTKRLSVSQKELCLQAGVSVIEYNAITVEFLPVFVPKRIENAIFTSKNGVRSIFSAEHNVIPEIKNCFCVGNETAELLGDFNQNVVEIGENSAHLGQLLIQHHKHSAFHYFCGEQRLETLPTMLSAKHISLEETVSYRTIPNHKKFDRFFDLVCFYSPSGVQSYAQWNSLENTVACCIGPTTASEAEKHTNTILIANKPSVVSTLTQAIKFRINDRT